jgi:hypothetical protein
VLVTKGSRRLGSSVRRAAITASKKARVAPSGVEELADGEMGADDEGRVVGEGEGLS